MWLGRRHASTWGPLPVHDPLGEMGTYCLVTEPRNSELKEYADDIQQLDTLLPVNQTPVSVSHSLFVPCLPPLMKSMIKC